MEQPPLFSPEWHAWVCAMPWQRQPPEGISEEIWQDVCGCREDSAGWEGSIDFFDGHVLTGWIKEPGCGESRVVDIYFNGRPLVKNITASQLREDVRAAGFGHGRYGYTVRLPFWEHDRSYVKVTVCAADGRIAAFRFFDLASSLALDLRHVTARDMTLRGFALQALPLWEAAGGVHADRGLMEAACAAARLCGSGRYCTIFSQWLADRDSQRKATACLASLKKYGGNERQALLAALEQIYSQKAAPADLLEAESIAAVFVELLRHEDNDILNILYNNFITNYIFPEPKHKKLINFLLERMVIACVDSAHMKYFLSVIKAFPAYTLDVLLLYRSDRDEQILHECRLEKYNVIYGVHNLIIYSTGLFDYNYFMNMREIQQYASHMTRIFLNHTYGILNFAPAFGDAAIMQCENLCKGFKNILVRHMDQSNRTNLAATPRTDRFEYAWAGPHHLSGLDVEKDKISCRRELEKVLCHSLPENKPLIFCIEDGTTLEGQLKYCLNALALDCTVVLKPYFRIDKRIHSRLDPRIVIYKDAGYAPNIPRLAADFILCSALTSSFFSCLMMGIPPLAVVSRYATNRSMTSRWLYPYMQHVRIYKDSLINPVWTYLYNQWPYFFDVLKVREIRAAIFQGQYLAWFWANLDNIRRQAFGAYDIARAADKTASLALRYASDGSFGEYCAAWAAKDGVNSGEGEAPGGDTPAAGFSS